MLVLFSPNCFAEVSLALLSKIVLNCENAELVGQTVKIFALFVMFFSSFCSSL